MLKVLNWLSKVVNVSKTKKIGKHELKEKQTLDL